MKRENAGRRERESRSETNETEPTNETPSVKRYMSAERNVWSMAAGRCGDGWWDMLGLRRKERGGCERTRARKAERWARNRL